MNRLQKVRQNLASQKIDALVVSQPENRRYLSGFTGSAGWLVISHSEALLAVDFRYVEQARKEAPHFEVVQIKGDVTNWLPELFLELEGKRVGFEADHTSFATYQQLCKVISDSRYQMQLVPISGLVESLRAVKEPEELELIRQAARLADTAMEYARTLIRPDVTEKEIAWALEKYLREKGSETVPFDIIVASGPNSALPHARASNRAILEGEPVVVDIGARVNGYCSDLSRTFLLGCEDRTFSRIYDIVLGAQLTAIATINTSMNGNEADQLARTVIEQAGYGEAFGHGLGHGLGLSAHETPRLGPSSSDFLLEGMVFTVEPGIYLSNWGGVRIEDTVIIEDGKVQPLTTSQKNANVFCRRMFA
ncbi:MAG TPA: aminopeptidase P family protein [Dehalococcoidia bacterium]|nr:aminopeptidase P family protein [Dehalococcoidia bacterium]